MTTKAQLLYGAPLADEIYQKCTSTAKMILAKCKRQPGLAFIFVGENPASAIYVNRKIKACKWVGINSKLLHLPTEASQAELEAKIIALNDDPTIDGILVQQPLPDHFDTAKIICTIKPEKDVDGFHPNNLGKVAAKLESHFRACTPLGCIRLINHTNLGIAGKRAAVIGRSLIVGKPMALLLTNNNATVTSCNSYTPDDTLKDICKQSDILVVAVGKPGLIRGDMIKLGAVVIDVGINRSDNGMLCGDVDFPSVSEKASWITPVPGGVGPMTVAMLIYNTIQAALATNKLSIVI